MIFPKAINGSNESLVDRAKRFAIPNPQYTEWGCGDDYGKWRRRLTMLKSQMRHLETHDEAIHKEAKRLRASIARAEEAMETLRASGRLSVSQLHRDETDEGLEGELQRKRA